MSNITDHPIVSHEEWLAERKALLAKEKEFNQLRDELGVPSALFDSLLRTST